MKRRSKELNIFSMSALDLFASALGAFILITVVLFPFFPNTGDSPERIRDVRAEMEARMQAQAEAAAEQIEALQQQLSQSQNELGQCSASLQDAQQQLNSTTENLQSCRAALQDTFVLVVINWSTSGDDVDLHVTDPNGNEYYYSERTHPGSDAAFEEDTTDGPGNEIWLSPNASRGRYTVEVNLYSHSSGEPIDVRGKVLYQNGRSQMSNITLTRDDERVTMATFVVDDEGNVTIE